MRLSTSLQKNILEATAGRVLNRFRIRSRRDTLFFEEIPAYYIKACEEAGYSADMRDIGQQWGYLITDKLLPAAMRRLPTSFVLNDVMRNVWANLGLMDDLSACVQGNIITFDTKNESITRFIGENQFTVGLHTGIFCALLGRRVDNVEAIQTKDACKYRFEVSDDVYSVPGKDKAAYDRLNSIPGSAGPALKGALKAGVFQLTDSNRLYFRGRRVVTIENTIFHLVGRRAIRLDEVQEVSHRFFAEVVEPDSSNEEKLNLLKTLLQVMGWGIVSIAVEGKRVCVDIKYPPCGLQAEKEDWGFLARAVLGYMWLMDEGFRLAGVSESGSDLSILFESG